MRRVSLTSLSLLALTAAGLSLASCSSPPVTGTLTGTLQAVGGPAGSKARPVSGQVTLQGSAGRIYTITLGANGRFSIHPAVGPVTVTKGATSSVEVDCQEGSQAG